MATSRSQIRTLFRKEVRIDPNGKIWDDTIVNDLFSQAYLKIQTDGQFNWPENEGQSDTITTSAGTEEYSLSSNLSSSLGRMELVMYDSIELYETEFRDAKLANPTDTQSSPSFYYLRGDNLGVYPIPDGAYTLKVYYRKRLAELTGDSDNIAFPDSMASLIVKYMAYLAWSGPRGNAQYAEEKLVQYERQLAQHKATYIVRSTAQLSKNYVVPRTRRDQYRPLALPSRWR